MVTSSLFDCITSEGENERVVCFFYVAIGESGLKEEAGCHEGVLDTSHYAMSLCLCLSIVWASAFTEDSGK